ncbi:MAG: N-acetylmuramoyl-L-alanine amidase [Clostridia bacterium]|nr:N-acetylmuramoyl-L-alanine amidase [Clostridia bacterium]
MNRTMQSTKSHKSRRFTIYFTFFCIVLAIIGTILIFVSVFSFKSIEKAADKTVDIIYKTDDIPLTIIIDAGHGGEDGGTIGQNGVIEKDLNLDIAFKVRDMLCAAGMKTVMTRTEDILLYDRNEDFMGHKKSLDLKARLNIEKSIPNSVFVSIHMNAFPNSKYSGLQVWYSKNDAGSKALARLIQSNTETWLQKENSRKIKAADSSIFLLDRADDAAVLIECGFLSNSEECEKLSDENYRRQLAFIIFSSIKEYSKNYGCNES